MTKANDAVEQRVRRVGAERVTYRTQGPFCDRWVATQGRPGSPSEPRHPAFFSAFFFLVMCDFSTSPIRA